MRTLFFVITILIAGITNSLTAADCDTMSAVLPQAAGSLPDSVAAEKKNIIGKIIDYFNESNKPKGNKKFDFSIIGGPHYSSDTKFGIGLVAAGLYRTCAADTMLPPSDVAVYADGTTSLFFMLGVRGTHILPSDRARLQYDVYFATVKSKFWGIGYAAGACDANESTYKYLNSQAQVSFVWRFGRNFYLGPQASFDYVNGRDFARPELLGDEPRRTFNLGVGFTLQYDSRDFLTNASHGVYARIDQRFNPGWLFNKQAFVLTELQFSYYHPLWKSATIACQLHSRLTFGDTPWGLLSTFGGSNTMRGYFEGRYRDKSEIDMCIELRQHVWRRNGIALWVGGGTVFPKFSAIRGSHLLPNYGIGYRWEFKRKVNVRLDLGFGRGETGFIFSINEAF